MGKDKWKDQQVFTPDGASTTVESREIESEALHCNDRTLKGLPLLWREWRRVLEEEEEEEWERRGGGGGSEMEQKLPTAVVQHAQQMLYFGRQRVERQRGERRVMGAQNSTLQPCLLFKVQQMERETRGGDMKILSF